MVPANLTGVRRKKVQAVLERDQEIASGLNLRKSTGNSAEDYNTRVSCRLTTWALAVARS